MQTNESKILELQAYYTFFEKINLCTQSAKNFNPPNKPMSGAKYVRISRVKPRIALIILEIEIVSIKKSQNAGWGNLAGNPH